VGPGACLEPGAYLTALSSLPAGGRIPAGECWDGVPAQRIGPSPEPAPLTASDRELSPWQLRAILLAVQLGLWPLLALPLCGLGLLALAWLRLDASAVLRWIQQPLSQPSGIVLLSAITVGSLPFGLALQALVLRWLPKVPAGTHGRWGSTYLWLWLRTGLLESAGVWLAGSLYWPLWLRLAGMRIGRKCEVSTILDVLPEHLSVGNESFLADGIYLGVPRVHRGRVTILPTSLGNGTFVGNHVVVHTGQHLPDNLVLGVCTVADDRLMTAGTGWFGHPPFQLPRREVIQVDRRLTHEPSLLRWCHRLFWESLRFLMPALPMALVLCWVDLAADAAATFSPAVLLLIILPALTLGAAAVITLTAVAAKWALLGRVRPGQHALWSCWASRWDFFYMLWDRYARLGLLQLEGTLLLGFCLRAAGVRLGKGVVLGPGFSQLVDPDMMQLEDGATVDAMFQAHSFEDRVLKLGLVKVGEGATACRASVLLYGAEIGAGARVAPHSVVMKHERLLPGQGYAGVPTAPVGAD
jgi:non-ribosomal peptide synthetase-like protein